MIPHGHLGQTGDFDTAGPTDQGALFDFGFGTLAANASKSFYLYYGAAQSRSAALSALSAVGAQVYSLAQPSTADGPTQGTPNTFMFGFRDTPLTGHPNTLALTEGQPFSGVVASFSDSSPSAQPSDYTVAIDWSDGNSTSGTVTATGGGNFNVTGAEVYAEDGNYAAKVTIQSVRGDKATVTSTAAVADAPLLGQGLSIAAAKGVPFADFPIASFTDADLNGVPSDYRATIDWGDTVSSTATGIPVPEPGDNGTPTASIIAGPNGSFLVAGSHLYSQEGVYPVTVTIADNSGGFVQTTSFAMVAVVAPSVTVTTPNSGSSAGGQAVRVSGMSFNGATAVSFGVTPATSFMVNVDGSITATAPAHATGVVDITVTTGGGTSATSAADQFTYLTTPAPAVSGIGPTSGPMAGGIAVTITGSNFTGATAVSFGGAPASSFTVNSTTQITATAPPRPAGTLDITVTTPSGTSVVNTADQFTYAGAAPTVSSISPNTDSTAGGMLITLFTAQVRWILLLSMPLAHPYSRLPISLPTRSMA